MLTSVRVPVFASLCLLSAAVAARPHVVQAAVIPASAMPPAQAAARAVKAPDTPSGRALTEFVNSFNAGGKTRQTWLETRTNVDDEQRASLLEIDAQVLEKEGPMTIVRIVSSSAESMAAIIRHGKSYRHGYLMIEVEPAAPHKVVNVGLRSATPEEIKGGE